jgi:hypothetical protein
VSVLASRQFGRISARQLRQIGVGKATIGRWVAASFLHRVLPGVYAVGHRSRSVAGDLAAALLYAGPGAMLSHATAVWWYGLLENMPTCTHISTPRRCRSLHGVNVHGERTLERAWRNGLPVVPPAQALLEFASMASLQSTRHVLASAEYHELLDLEALAATTRRGRKGSARLNQALKIHEPRLARTRSRLERAFLALCERYRIPLPEVNEYAAGLLVDAYWPEHGFVVELDGNRNHSTRAQIERDRRRELRLRQAGLAHARYTEDQIKTEPHTVAEDVKRAID